MLRRVGLCLVLLLGSSSFHLQDAGAGPEPCRRARANGGYCILIFEDDGRQYKGSQINCSHSFVHPNRTDHYASLSWVDDEDRRGNPSHTRYCEGRKVNDTVTSFTNDSDAWVLFAEHINLGGRRFCAPPYTYVDDLKKFKGANDIFSSHETSMQSPGNCTWTSKDRTR